jgi:fructoselysine-6-phosphate deglycase
MLNFDETRYLRIQDAAVAVAERLGETVHTLRADGLRNVYFLGAGGAGVLMIPAVQLLQRRAQVEAYLENAAEIVTVGSERLGTGSLAVVPSLSGTTAEALAVARYAKECGGTVLALVGDASAPLADVADIVFEVPAADDTSSESFYVQSLGLALSILRDEGRCAEYDHIIADLRRLPQALVAAKEAFEPMARRVAETIAADGYHIITGAGPLWTQAWYYGTCILEEMQWIRTRPIHASDFFHGTLELVEKNVSVIVLAGPDATRPLAERVLAWAPTVSDAVTLLDVAAFELPGVSPTTRDLIPHVVAAALLERVSAHLEVIRDHPLTTRRYYRRLAY